MDLKLRTLKRSGFKYWIRVNRHSFLTWAMLKLAKFIVHQFIAAKPVTELKVLNEKNNDQYPSCKASMKQFCPIGKPAKYMLYIKGDGYGFYGADELECYLRCIIAMWADSPRIYPGRRLKQVIRD